MRPALERPGRGGSNESSLEHFRQSVQEKINNGDKELDKARKKAREKESERERGEKDLVGLERDIDELKPETERPGKEPTQNTTNIAHIAYGRLGYSSVSLRSSSRELCTSYIVA
mmetsp:Transcript_25375/g.45962  ORF Transcript_25375/g.45962 Transcript_25375/m.45962 type:complete len:115 (-) Transcript_25375:180-524(-)